MPGEIYGNGEIIRFDRPKELFVNGELCNDCMKETSVNSRKSYLMMMYRYGDLFSLSFWVISSLDKETWSVFVFLL